MEIKVINKSDNPLPKYESSGASGMDLLSNESIVINTNETVMIGTGIYVEIPEGYEMQVRSRSGLAKNNIFIPHGIGTIDSDYRGEIKVLLRNVNSTDVYIHKGMRIAQLVLAPVSYCEWQEVSELSDTKRGTGGFGSTGVTTEERK